jgi:hypothetical protein
LLCFPMSVRKEVYEELVGTASLVGLRIHALRQAAFYIDS